MIRALNRMETENLILCGADPSLLVTTVVVQDKGHWWLYHLPTGTVKTCGDNWPVFYGVVVDLDWLRGVL